MLKDKEELPKLSDLLDVPLLQSIVDDFYKIAGFGIGIIDNEGNVLVGKGWQDICTKFHRVHPETNRKCIESDLFLTKDVEQGTFKLYKCKNNLWDMSTPIIISGKHLGNIFLGQFIFDDEEVDYDAFRSYARQYGFDEEKYIEALDKVPRWSRKSVNYVMSLYSKLALLFSEIGLNNFRLKQALTENEKVVMSLIESNKSYMLLSEETIRKTKEIEGLLKIASAVFENKDIKKISKLIYDVSKELIGSTVGFVSLFSKNHFKDDISFCDIDGLGCAILQTKEFPLSFLRTTAYKLETAFFDNNFGQRAIKNFPEGHINIENLLVSPIVFFGNVTGIIGLGNKQSGFDSRDIDIITKISEISALAISNIISTESLELSEINLNSLVNKLTESEIRLKIALESANAGVWQWNIDTDEMYWSDELWKLYALNPHSFNPSISNWRQIVHPSDLKTFDGAIKKSREGHKKLRFEWRILTDDNNIKWILTRGQQIDDNLRQFTGISIDITRRKLSEIELQEAKELAEIANNTKSLFLANMSHELRTPMNAVVGFLDLLETTPLKNQQKIYLQGIRHSADVMIQLLADILDLSNLQRGKAEIKTETFSIRALLNEIIQAFDFSTKQKGLNLNLIIDESIPDMLIGDIKRLRQIITILLNNALKYTEKGGIELQAFFSKKESDKRVQVHFVVKDTGIGIPADKQELIFESFTQVDMSVTRKYQGAGLGLAICKELIELMKGSIWLESEVGVGSEFHFAVDFEISKPEIETKEEKQEEKINQPIKDLKVLLVEDNALNQMVLKKLLENRHFYVDICANGLEAIKKLEEKRYDLVFMDIQMPVMNGDEATKIIRDKSSNVLDHDLPIIAVTAHALEGDRERFLECGFNEYVAKPIKIYELDSVIKKVMQCSKYFSDA
ncbi:MAG: PocR ligand-binding domain-containing protein [Thermodesulfovibrionales bacterium]|nr:PocR ligand-binding domain-containing protein [Thermodesulfovibrionales bacterium]